MTITMMIVIVNFMEENIFIEENRQDYGSGKEDPSSYQNGPTPNQGHETSSSKIKLNHPRPNFDFHLLANKKWAS